MTDKIRVAATGSNLKEIFHFELTTTIEQILKEIKNRFDSLRYTGPVKICFECPAVVDPADENSSKKSWNINKKLLLTAGGIALGAAATPILLPAALGAAGFTSAGVAAGSAAAGIQSAFYGGYVASGSAFAVCQSIGAAGVGATSVAAGGVAGGAVGGAVAGILGLSQLEITVQQENKKPVVFNVSKTNTLEDIISKIRGHGIHVAASVSMNFKI